MKLDKNGMIFITALAVMVLLMGIGLASLYVARQETMISGNELGTLKAYYLAEAGIEYGIAAMINDGWTWQGYPTSVGGDLRDPQDQSTIIGTYSAQLINNGKTLLGHGQTGSFSRYTQAMIATDGFPAAVIAGNGINITSSGTINGKVIAGNFTPTSMPNMTIIGGVKNNGGPSITSQIPEPNFDAYYQEFITGNPNYIAYYPGDKIWNSGVTSAQPMVVRGTLTLNLTDTTWTRDPSINAGHHYPAIIVEKQLIINANNVTLIFGGLVYAKEGISVQGNNINVTIKGALVLAGTGNSTLTIGNGTLNVTYDSAMNNPYFAVNDLAPKPAIVPW